MARWRVVGLVGGLTLALGWPSMSLAERPMGDLIVSAIVPSATEAPKIFVIVRHVGARALSRPVGVALWLEKQLLGRQTVAPGAFKAGKPVHVEFLRPVDMPAGLHNFTATVDPDEAIPELDDTNNTRGITVWVNAADASPGPAGGSE